MEESISHGLQQDLIDEGFESNGMFWIIEQILNLLTNVREHGVRVCPLKHILARFVTNLL